MNINSPLLHSEIKKESALQRWFLPFVFVAIVIILAVEVKQLAAEAPYFPKLDNCFTITVLKDFNAGDIISREEIICGYGKPQKRVTKSELDPNVYHVDYVNYIFI